MSIIKCGYNIHIHHTNTHTTISTSLCDLCVLFPNEVEKFHKRLTQFDTVSCLLFIVLVFLKILYFCSERETKISIPVILRTVISYKECNIRDSCVKSASLINLWEQFCYELWKKKKKIEAHFRLEQKRYRFPSHNGKKMFIHVLLPQMLGKIKVGYLKWISDTDF